ncbi:MAG TPA: DUF2993 domain-containing protein [Jatrophihabitans sp.]
MTTLLVVVAVLGGLALLAVTVVALDRYLAREAERRASEYLTVPLGQTAWVRVHGTPFLTQAIRGRYDRVEVSASGMQFGVLGDTTMQAHLVNVYLPLRDVLAKRTNELSVERLHGDLVIAYRELARVSRIPGLRFSYSDDRLIATAGVPVPGISQLARLSGEAVASIGDGGVVWLRVRNVSLAGITVPGLVLSQFVPSLAFPVPLPALPYGLRIEALTPTPDGLQVSGSAAAVTFRRTVRPAG